MPKKKLKRSKLALDTTNYAGKRVVYEKDRLRKKWYKHPEVEEDPDFLDRVARNIEVPDMVYKSKKDPSDRCYYCKDGWKNPLTKVIISTKTRPYLVKTAFATDKVSEDKRLK